jgi:hypothetical protein
MRRHVAALAAICLVSGPASAEPCPAIVGVMAGRAAPCSGMLTPLDYPDACTANTESLLACRERREGDRARHAAELAAARDTIARVEAARIADRVSYQTLLADREEPGFAWGTLAIGVLVGVAAGIAVGVAVR